MSLLSSLITSPLIYPLNVPSLISYNLSSHIPPAVLSEAGVPHETLLHLLQESMFTASNRDEDMALAFGDNLAMSVKVRDTQHLHNKHNIGHYCCISGNYSL